MIELKQVTRTYKLGEHEIHALDQVDLDISDGEFVAVVGPSGSGKSTLLHIVGGIDTPTSGQVLVDGQDLSQASDRKLALFRNRQVGFVFQTFNLQPTYTALENVALPLVFAKVPPKERRASALNALEAVGLADRVKHKPAQLSGGERQRVAIARALVSDPAYVLADEPTGNLDTELAFEIMSVFSEINKQGTTVLICTHDRELIRHYGEKILFLYKGKILRKEQL